MMSMMTLLVVMFAIGTLINRSDLFDRLMGGEKVALELMRDDAIVRANQLIPIDVLANDKGLEVGDSERLTVAEQPKCGRVYVRDGVLQYLAAERCVGSQTFRYAISGRSGEQTGEVIAVVRLGEPTQNEMDTGGQDNAQAPAPVPAQATQAETAAAPATTIAQPAPDGTEAANAPSAPAVPRPAAPAAPAGLDMATAPATEADQAPAVAPLPARTLVEAARTDPAAAGATAIHPNGATFSMTGGGAAPTAETGTAGAQPDAAQGTGQDQQLAAVDTSSTPAPGQPARTVTPGDTPNATPNATPTVTPTVTPAAPRQPAAPCTTPPTLTLDSEPGGITLVMVDSPCQAGTVAELAYDGLRFGIQLDEAGTGSVQAVGLQKASDAVVRFADRSETRFLLTFDDMDRLERVALFWEAPVALELHAFEFGAGPADPGHVGPGNRRSFDDVRRRGGGYLLEFAPIDGVGQSLQVYSFWRGHGGKPGVVRMALDFAGRTGPAAPDTCGDGAQAEPDFTVLRSEGGRIERPALGRLAPLGCAAVAGLSDRFIGDAVDDLIVTHR